MHRRSFLAVTTMAAVSGCLGYEIQSSSDVKERSRRIEDLRSRIDQLEEQVETANSTLENKNTEIDELESQLETRRREEIALLYDEVVTTQQYGSGAWGNAIDAWNSENYSLADSYFSRAYARYADSTRRMETILDKVQEYELDVQRVLDDIEEFSRLMREASFTYSQAASAVTNERYERASTLQDTAQDDYDEAQQIDLIDASELRDRLGLSGDSRT